MFSIINLKKLLQVLITTCVLGIQLPLGAGALSQAPKRAATTTYRAGQRILRVPQRTLMTPAASRAAQRAWQIGYSTSKIVPSRYFSQQVREKHEITTRADVEAMIAQQKKGERLNLRNRDFIAVNLSGLNLSGADLRSSNLKGANLTNTNLDGADLMGVKFDDANLTNTDLSNADLRFSSLNDAARFHNIKLKGADISDTWLQEILGKVEIDFSDLDLTNTNFSKSKLRGANFSNSNLSNSNLTSSILSHANFKGANLSNVHLRGADLQGANLRNADLTGADLTGANLKDADLTGVKNIEHMLSEKQKKQWEETQRKGLKEIRPEVQAREEREKKHKEKLQQETEASSLRPESVSSRSSQELIEALGASGLEEAELKARSILGVKPAASASEINDAYMKLAYKWLPDPKASEDERTYSMVMLKKARAAFELLQAIGRK